MQLRLLERHQIDTARWDALLRQSPDARLYATSNFLDAMAPGWKALVAGDYEMIMPLPVRKKWGIDYVFQPAFCQQLGVFANTTVTPPIVDAFLQAVATQFSYAEYNLQAQALPAKWPCKLRKNYLLHLQPAYEILEKSFSRSAKRNIRKAEDAGVTVQVITDTEALFQLHKQRYGNLFSTDADQLALANFFKKASGEAQTFCFGAFNAKGEMIASSGYVQYGQRLYFLVNGNLPEALDCGATHLLKAHALQHFAGKDLWMDFEGSDTASFARFYEQYGATACDNYPFVVINKLPFPLKNWKKRQLEKSGALGNS